MVVHGGFAEATKALYFYCVLFHMCVGNGAKELPKHTFWCLGWCLTTKLHQNSKNYFFTIARNKAILFQTIFWLMLSSLEKNIFHSHTLFALLSIMLLRSLNTLNTRGLCIKYPLQVATPSTPKYPRVNILLVILFPRRDREEWNLLQ